MDRSCFSDLLFIGIFYFAQIALTSVLQSLKNPSDLLLSDLPICTPVDDFHQLFNLPFAGFRSIILQKNKDILDTKPMVTVLVESRHDSWQGVVFALDQLPPQFDYPHLSVHDLSQHSSEDGQLLENCFFVSCLTVRVFYSFGHDLSKFKVVSWEQEGGKLQSTYFPNFHSIKPAKSISQKFSMLGTQNCQEILLP